jgi:hypothetical protein
MPTSRSTRQETGSWYFIVQGRHLIVPCKLLCPSAAVMVMFGLCDVDKNVLKLAA